MFKLSPLAAYHAKDYQENAAKLRREAITSGYKLIKTKWSAIDYRYAREAMGVTDADQYFA